MLMEKLIPLFYIFFQYFLPSGLERMQKACKITVNSSKNFSGGISMLKKIVVAVAAGVIIAALLLPALASHTVFAGKVIATHNVQSEAIAPPRHASLTR